MRYYFNFYVISFLKLDFYNSYTKSKHRILITKYEHIINHLNQGAIASGAKLIIINTKEIFIKKIHHSRICGVTCTGLSLSIEALSLFKYISRYVFEKAECLA